MQAPGGKGRETKGQRNKYPTGGEVIVSTEHNRVLFFHSCFWGVLCMYRIIAVQCDAQHIITNICILILPPIHQWISLPT